VALRREPGLQRVAVFYAQDDAALATPEQIQSDPLVIEAYLGVKG
jgi:hypothetical protein